MRRLLESSTFWCGVVVISLDAVANHYGYPVRWELAATLIGAYGFKERGRIH